MMADKTFESTVYMRSEADTVAMGECFYSSGISAFIINHHKLCHKHLATKSKPERGKAGNHGITSRDEKENANALFKMLFKQTSNFILEG